MAKYNELHLTIKKKWFDMIITGEKKEEYREIKEYWRQRLTNMNQPNCDTYKKFDVIVFRNGYSKDARKAIVQCKRIHVGFGKKEWGAENQPYYIISLGKVLLAKK